MSAWEYKVVPAPTKGIKAKGLKGPEERFAHALEILMNDMGSDGWEFQRAETLPSLERSGLTGTTTEWRNMMVFRRALTTAADEFEHELLPAPEPTVRSDPKLSPPSMFSGQTTREAAADTAPAESDPRNEFERNDLSGDNNATAQAAQQPEDEAKDHAGDASHPKTT